jgi:polysaccharide transporter, PST family
MDERTKTPAKMRLVLNAISLYSVQGLQYLSILISLPWLVRALGTDGYGWISIAGAFGGYLQVFCEYGFQWTASRDIAINRNTPNGPNRIISAVLGAKSILALGGIIAASVAIALIPTYHSHAIELALGGVGALAGAFHPSWVFQGMERLGRMALISSSTRIIQLALVLALINDTGDLRLVLAINCTIALLNTSAAWILAHHYFKLDLQFPPITECINYLRNGFEIFISQAGALLFSNTNVMLLGIYVSPQAVGFYSIAEKAVRIVIQVSAPIGSVIFPRVAILLNTSHSIAFAFLRRILLWGSIAFATLSLLLVISSEIIVRFICGYDEARIYPLIWILSPLPLTIFINSIFGVQILLNTGYRKTFMAIPLSAGILALGLQYLLIPKFGIQGAAWSLCISEIWILCLYVFFTWMRTGFPFNPKT